MNKKFRVLLSAFLSVAVATSSLSVTAAAEGFDAFWGTEQTDSWTGGFLSEPIQSDDSSDIFVNDISESADVTEEVAVEQPAVTESVTMPAEDIRFVNVVEDRKNASASEIAALKAEIAAGNAKGTCSDGLSWNIDSSFTLTISGAGAMTDASLPWQDYAPVVTKIVISDTVTSISAEAFLGFVVATDVTIGKGVVTISDRAFYGCVKLASLAINATALETIGSGAFYDCTPLVNLTIPSTVTFIGDNAFSGCKKITQVTVPAGVSTLGKGAFYGCEALETVTISDGVKVIDERAFAACIALETLKLPSDLTAINKEAFSGCVALTTINGKSDALVLPESVTNIGESAFSSCNAIKGVVISGDIANIAKYAFKSCTGLTSVNITGTSEAPAAIADEAFAATPILNKVTLENVKTIGLKAFYQSGIQEITLSEGLETIGNFAFSETNLKSIIIPASVQTVNTSAFAKCLELESFSVASPDAQVKFLATVFSDCTSLRTLNLEGIGTFGQEMFRNCTAITSVTLPVSATVSNAKVFSGCTNLKTATAPEGVKVIGSQMFFGCPITEFTIPSTALTCHGIFQAHTDIKTVVSNTPRIGERAFENCTNLTSITLNNTVEIGGDIALNKKYGNAFAGCTGLTEIVLPDTVTVIHPGAFQDCFGITTITIPDGVTELQSGLFENCKNLEEIKIKGDGVINLIGNETFKDCISLTDIPVSDYITVIGYGAFSGCTGITEMTIPEGVTVIDRSTFESCTALKTVKLEGNITKIGDKAFMNCGAMVGFEIPPTVTSIGASAFSGCTYLNSQIPSGVTTIGSNAFQNCVNLGADINGEDFDIVLPTGLKTISASAFQGCTSLNDVTISENVTTIGGNAFQGCNSKEFTRITVPKSVTTIGNSAFEGCSNLQSVTIVTGDKSCNSIGSKAFYNCTALRTITLPTTLKSIAASAFENCSKLGSVLIAADVTTLGTGAFKNCSSLESAALSATQLKTISTDTFSGCTSLKTVELPDTVTSIGGNAFLNCKSLVNITIPGGVTTLGNNAFENCSSLEMIVIPVPNKSFGSNTFKGCSSLTAAIILSMNSITTTPFNGCENVTIYCYEGAPAETYAEKNEIPCENLVGSDGAYIAILQRPETMTEVAIGDTINLSVKVASEGKLTYKWYYKNPGSSNFTQASATGNTYSFTLTEANNGVSVYCEITSVSSNDEATETTTKIDEVIVASLKAPKISSVTAGDNSVTFNWNKISGATSYRVYRADSLDGSKKLLKAVNTLTYTDTTAEAGKTYYYFVAAYNNNLKILGGYSAAAKATVPVPLSKTTAVAVSGGGNATITWDAVDNATSYRVFRSTSLTGTRTLEKVRTSTYYIDTNVDTGKTYYYWIMAYNANTGAKSSYSAATSVKIVDTFAKSIEIKSASVLSTSVTLSWDMIPGATSYRIYRRNDDGTRSLLYAQSMTEYKDTGLTKGKIYKYEIRGYSATTGALTAYSAIKQVRPMAAPTITSGNVKGKITWDKNAVATSYRVYRADSLTGAKKLLKPVTTTTYTDTTAVKGKTYYYFVAAYDNTTGTLSAYSNAKAIKIS